MADLLIRSFANYTKVLSLIKVKIIINFEMVKNPIPVYNQCITMYQFYKKINKVFINESTLV